VLEADRWRREVAWHRELLEELADDLECLSLQPGRTEQDYWVLKRRAARIRQQLYRRTWTREVPE
jgi:hypothetical protein